jgi:hypothetical protein
MTEDDARAEAQRYYTDYLMEPYQPFADVYTSPPEIDLVAECWRLQVWSRLDPERIPLLVGFDGTVTEEEGEVAG